MLNDVKQLIHTNGPGDIHYKKWDIGFRDEYFSKIYWSYFPITEKYYFEGNPSFLYEYKNEFDLSRYPLITLRDGFVGLLDFFLTHPTPSEDFKSKLIVNKKFESLVPKQWSELVSTYSIEPCRDEVTEKNTLLIHGLAVEELFWNKTPIEMLKDLKKISDNFKDVVFILPQRESLMSTEDNQQNQYTMKLMKAIYEIFGFDAKIEMHVNDFFEKFNEVKFHFYNLDIDNVFISDNYIDHYLYSIGGSSLNSTFKPSVKENLEYNLSSNHKMVISDLNVNKNLFSKFYLPHKLSGRKNISIYDVYRSNIFKKLFIEFF